MSICSDCNWFSTRGEYCSKKHKKVNSQDNVCDDDFWPIARPMPVDDELVDHFKICTDCLEKGYSLFNNYKYCPICGKELKK